MTVFDDIVLLSLLKTTCLKIKFYDGRILLDRIVSMTFQIILLPSRMLHLFYSLKENHLVTRSIILLLVKSEMGE